MARNLTLPIIIGLVLGGTGIGVHLGRSALSEIDPAHYQDSTQSRFFASLTPQGLGSANQNPPDDYWESESRVTRGEKCPTCELLPAEYSIDEVFAPSGEYDHEEGVVQEAAYEFGLPPEEPPSRARDGALQAYSSYPLTEEERERRAAAPVPALHSPAETPESGCSDISSVEEGCPTISAS